MDMDGDFGDDRSHASDEHRYDESKRAVYEVLAECGEEVEIDGKIYILIAKDKLGEKKKLDELDASNWAIPLVFILIVLFVIFVFSIT